MSRWASLLIATLVLCGCDHLQQGAVITRKLHVPAHQGDGPYEDYQTNEERWLVFIEMDDGQRAHTPLDEAEWKTYQVGDRVHASYTRGKYTRSIWTVTLRRP